MDVGEHPFAWPEPPCWVSHVKRLCVAHNNSCCNWTNLWDQRQCDQFRRYRIRSGTNIHLLTVQYIVIRIMVLCMGFAFFFKYIFKSNYVYIVFCCKFIYIFTRGNTGEEEENQTERKIWEV